MAVGSHGPHSQVSGRHNVTPSVELDRLDDPLALQNERRDSDIDAFYDPPRMARLTASKIERRVRLKLDFILLPFLSLLFLFNSLDKSNIGSAETGHFTKDTGLPPSALNRSVACFFAAFVTLQPVGAALGRKYGMARYVPTCMALWGLLTAAHILVKREWQLIVLRTAVGVLEAGFYPTTVNYLSLFYTKFEFAKRLGMFYGQAALAGAFGGVLSWVVFRHFPETRGPDAQPGSHTVSASTASGWKSWQVLFLIEGVATMVIALIGFVWLPHSASTAWFLTPDERRCAENRVREDREQPNSNEHAEDQHTDDQNKHDTAESPRLQGVDHSHSRHSSDEGEGLLAEGSRRDVDLTQSFHSSRSMTEDRGLTRTDITAAVTDWKVWYLLVCNILSALPATAFSVFLPLVVRGLAGSGKGEGSHEGMTAARANLLTVPPFLAGAIVLWSFTAWSDRSRHRLVPILWGLGILIVGLTATVMLPRHAHVARYFALIVLLSGSFVASPLTVAWLTNNMLEPGKRAIVLGINGWGNLAGVLSAMLFAPRYRAGGYVVPFFVTLSCVGMSFIGFVVFRLLILAINQQRAALVSQWTPEDREQEALQGDVHVSARLSPRWLQSHSSTRQRMGEERLTFHFGL